MKKHASCWDNVNLILAPRVFSVFKMALDRHVESRWETGDERTFHARHEKFCELTNLMPGMKKNSGLFGSVYDSN